MMWTNIIMIIDNHKAINVDSYYAIYIIQSLTHCNIHMHYIWRYTSVDNHKAINVYSYYALYIIHALTHGNIYMHYIERYTCTSGR